MSRFIDADKAKELYIKTIFVLKGHPSTKEHPLMSTTTESLESFREIFEYLIDRVPTADVAEVRHGYWINGKGKRVQLDDNGWVTDESYCSVCGDILSASDEYAVTGRYCPNCGARMDGADNE